DRCDRTCDPVTSKTRSSAVGLVCREQTCNEWSPFRSSVSRALTCEMRLWLRRPSSIRARAVARGGDFHHQRWTSTKLARSAPGADEFAAGVAQYLLVVHRVDGVCLRIEARVESADAGLKRRVRRKQSGERPRR